MANFALVVNLVAKAEHADKFLEMAIENAKATRETEAGCSQFDVLVDPEDKTRISFYEVYDNAEAFELHQKTEHFLYYVEHAVPLLDSRDRIFFNRVAP